LSFLELFSRKILFSTYRCFFWRSRCGAVMQCSAGLCDATWFGSVQKSTI
jgi:hypothetical protein